MATVPSASERLAEARMALHALNTGTAVVEVRDANGETVRYNLASVRSLERYIVALEREVAGTARKPGIIRFSTSKGI